MTHFPSLLDLEPVVAAEMARWAVPGIVVGVLRDAEIEARAWGVASLRSGEPLRVDALFRVASISKVFTATLAMTLVDEGRLDLDAPVIEYLPDLRLADARAQVTVSMRQLLSHQSGLFGDYFVDHGMGVDALATAVSQFHTLRQQTAPGELWTYCNSGFHLAGRVIEHRLGVPFDQAMRERVFGPLGLERTCFFAHEAIVWPYAVGHDPVTPGSEQHVVAGQYYPRNRLPAGGVISNAAELLAFARCHLSGDPPLLRSEMLAAMRTPQVPAANFADAWGIGWSLRTIGGASIIGHGGTVNGCQTHLTLIPEAGLAFAVLTNSLRGSAAIHPIEAALLEGYAGLRAEPRARVSLSPAQLAHFAGRYAQPLAEIDVAVDGAGLRLDIQRVEGDARVPYPSVPLAPIGEREFIATAGESEGSRVDFIERPDGSVRFIRFGGRLADRA